MTSTNLHWRLYCLVPDLDAARAVAQELSCADVEPFRLRVIVRRETPVVGLPEASLRERAALVQAARRGLMMGGMGGAIAGLVAAFEIAAHLVLAFVLVPLAGLAGAVVGAWICSMMGVGRPHPEVSAYQKAIDAGYVLILIHTRHERLETMQRLIKRQHPGARFSRAGDTTGRTTTQA